MINDDISINFSKNWKHLLSTVVRRKKWGGEDGWGGEKGGGRGWSIVLDCDCLIVMGHNNRKRLSCYKIFDKYLVAVTQTCVSIVIRMTQNRISEYL